MVRVTRLKLATSTLARLHSINWVTPAFLQTDREGFEPPIRFLVCRFSRPVYSATLPSVQKTKLGYFDSNEDSWFQRPMLLPLNYTPKLFGTLSCLYFPRSCSMYQNLLHIFFIYIPKFFRCIICHCFRIESI